MDKIFEEVLHFLSFRPRSQHEVKMWLERRKIGSKHSQEVLQKLSGLKLIDDMKFAEWWVEQRKTFRPKSLRLIKLELHQKGITREILDNLKLDVNEKAEAFEILKKKFPLWQKLSQEAIRQKAMSYLGRRGYNWDTVKGAIDQLVKKD